MKKAKALVIYGDGINCENETAYALELAGFAAEKHHCLDLLENPVLLKDMQLLALPGGFSFGDEIASGKVMAIKLREKLQDALHNFIDQGKLLIGICNGFQILVQLEILPDSSKGAERSVSLCHNESGKFINRWVKLEVKNKSRFFEGLKSIHLPIRHGEGKLTLASGAEESLEMKLKARAPLRYSQDVNGSFDRIAALTNEADNVLGLMPHPEAFVRWNQHPNWGQLKYGDTKGELALSRNSLSTTAHGLQILKNAAAILN
ncbi:MAG: phosphoribosylformylglycinamidine synthase subunit PurQ [Candidatus Obscuribacterales bacterium]|nr:phosphoribosylformylglycinamidine synthase subunit PurQ [Candidatus Obscuribacterales bacterium]